MTRTRRWSCLPSGEPTLSTLPIDWNIPMLRSQHGFQREKTSAQLSRALGKKHREVTFAPPPRLIARLRRAAVRCFRCMAKDHQVKECREPLKCLECGQSDHRRVSCPHRTSTQPKIVANRHTATGLFTCLVGEVRGSSPTWEHILSGLQDILAVLGIPDYHRLASGDIILQNLS